MYWRDGKESVRFTWLLIRFEFLSFQFISWDQMIWIYGAEKDFELAD